MSRRRLVPLMVASLVGRSLGTIFTSKAHVRSLGVMTGLYTFKPIFEDPEGRPRALGAQPAKWDSSDPRTVRKWLTAFSPQAR
jgi:hypothetical protein